MTADPFAQFKAAQRESWGLFAPIAASTTPPAASLVEFANVAPGDLVLDVGCGTGVVAVTAARAGAGVRGLDLSPVLLDEARRNAQVAGVDIEFSEGDVEALPWPDATFDVVLSQYGHMFAPRPEVAVAEMLRVLKPGGRIAFSTWPPEMMIGRMFTLVAGYLPPPPGVAPPPQWGEPTIVLQRLGEKVREVEFRRDELRFATLSPSHFVALMEQAAGPVARVVAMLADDPPRLARFRGEFVALVERFFDRNIVHQSFLMTRALKA